MNKIIQLTDKDNNNIYPIAYAQSGVKIEKLWENPNMTASFSPQTIALDLSDYEFIIVRFQTCNSANSSYVTELTKVDGKKCNFTAIASQVNTNIYSRSFIPTSTGIQFYDGYVGGTVANLDARPYQVYGVKR